MEDMDVEQYWEYGDETDGREMSKVKMHYTARLSVILSVLGLYCKCNHDESGRGMQG